jgi:hypothetical protein
LWCHEIKLQPNYTNSPAITGYYSRDEFGKMLNERMSLVNAFRSTLTSDVDFSNTQDHTKGELLYLSFMEPSADRLAREWGLTVEGVKTKLVGMTVHDYPEFPFLGNELYYRKDIEKFAPYSSIPVPEEAREASTYEPDFIHF